MFIYYRTPLHGHPLNMDTSLLWSLSFVPRENLSFSLNPTHLIRKSVNVDNGHFSLVQSTDSYGKLTLLIRTLPCQLCVAIWERREERAFPGTDPTLGSPVSFIGSANTPRDNSPLKKEKRIQQQQQQQQPDDKKMFSTSASECFSSSSSFSSTPCSSPSHC